MPIPSLHPLPPCGGSVSRDADRADLRYAPDVTAQSDYAELKRRIGEAGLLG